MRSRPTSPQPDVRSTRARHEARANRHVRRSTPVGTLRAHVRADVQTRAAGNTGDELIVEGYAAVFEQPSEVMSFWGIEWDERIARGAFTNVLAADDLDVRFMGQHEGNALARTTNGTLELREDETGLWFRASLNPDVQEARDLYALIERGDITQMSFGFCMAPPSSLTCEKLGHDLCHIEHDLINEVTRLFEISAVTFPAYPQTSVEGGERSTQAAAERSTSTDNAGATLAAETIPPSGEGSTRDAALRQQITTWSKRWSTCDRSVPSS